MIYLISLDVLCNFPRLKDYKSNNLKKMKYRGLGVLYLAALIPFFYICFSYMSINIIILISILTFFGFIDDKYDLSSKLKLFVIIFISLFYNILAIGIDKSFLNLIEFLHFFNKFIFLIFLILFFNQIDGINGLAGLTYFTSVLTIFLVFGNSLIFITFLILIIIYLFFNLRGKVGIHGDSGSYFLASTFFVLITEYTNDLYFFHSLLFLCPILFDVVSTTLIRLFFKQNILKPHKDNLYQKFAYHYKSHIISTLSFILLQIIFSLIILFLLKYNALIYIFILSLFTFISFIYLSYLIYKRKIFC